MRTACRSCGAEGTLYGPMQHQADCPFGPPPRAHLAEPERPAPVQTSADCRELEADAPCRFVGTCHQLRRRIQVAAALRGQFCWAFQSIAAREAAAAAASADATGAP